jgi:endonuclease YncB( thermonuclease family)
VREPTRPSIMRRRALITMGVCALVLVIWWAIRTPEPPPPPAVPFGPGDALRAQVLGVVDGTTIQVEIEGGHERIHYLGIEPLGHPATEANRHLVQSKRVWLELDVPLRDRDGRLLAYVYVGDLMVNAELVRQGYAQVTTVPPSGKYAPLFQQLQREAQEAGRGVWGAK